MAIRMVVEYADGDWTDTASREQVCELVRKGILKVVEAEKEKKEACSMLGRCLARRRPKRED